MGLDLHARPPTVAPPAKTRQAGPKRPTHTDASKMKERTEGLEGLGQLGAGICLATGQYADAAALGQHWPNVAKETADLAGRYESVGNVVDKLISVGPFVGLISAVMPLVLQVLVNHQRLPGEGMAQFGVVPKEALDAQGKAAAMRQLQAAQMEQAQAEQELAEMAAQMEAMAASQNGGSPQPQPEPVRS